MLRSLYFLTCLVVISIAPNWSNAQTVSEAYAVHGGRSTAISITYGDGFAESISHSDGGEAEAVQISRGLNGGKAIGRNVAQTIGGRAVSQGVTTAYGYGSRAESDLVSSSHYGDSLVKGDFEAQHGGLVNGHLTGLSDRGQARVVGQAFARHGVSEIELLGHDFGPGTYVHGSAKSVADFSSWARSQTFGVGVGRLGHSQVSSHAFSEAFDNSYAEAKSESYDDN